MSSTAPLNVIRSALVLSGGMFEHDAVEAVAEALLTLPHATGKQGDEQYEKTVRGIAQVAFTALFEHCSRHRGTIDLPLNGTPYAAMLLLAGSLVAENEQMREAARRKAMFGLEREQNLMGQIAHLQEIAEGYNSLHGSKPTASAREVAQMAWVDHRHRHNIGGAHTPRFCKACGESGIEAQRLFGEISDEACNQQGVAGQLPRLLAGHVSVETAFVVRSSDQARPKQRQDDHLMRYWIETRASGTKAGWQRLMHQSTYRCEAGEWNPPQHSSYSPLVIMYLDENGKFRHDLFSARAENPVSARAFRRSSLYAQLDDTQRSTFEQMCETAQREYPESWARFENNSRAVADYIRDTGQEPQPDDDGSGASPDGKITIRHTFREHLERARELLQQADPIQ